MAETQVVPRSRRITLPAALGRLTAVQLMAVQATPVTFSAGWPR